MTLKRVVPRPQAADDVDCAIDHYLREGGVDVALGFVDAIETAFCAIAEHPRIGSLRYGHELGLSGLRHRRLARYPWLVFYVEHNDRIDVWRVLDARFNIPGWLGEPGKE
jgi:toxin ParE1/3/4